MKSMLKDAFILFIITVIAGLALGVVYQVTKGPIAIQEAKTKEKAYKEVFLLADSFQAYEDFNPEEAVTALEAAKLPKDEIVEVMEALDEGGGLMGYVITVVSHEAYGDDLKFSMGVKVDGQLNGISILSISETVGFGMKANTKEFKEQFENKQTETIRHVKTGAEGESEIDAISGATITTNAMTNGVNAGLAYFRSITEGGGQNE